MQKLSGIVFAGFVGTMMAAAASFSTSAAAASKQYIDIAAASFEGKKSSYHNDGQAPDACSTKVALDVGEENRGDLQNAAGSFIANVVVPRFVKVSKFTLFANDADANINATAYLMRKSISPGLKPAKAGIVVMAEVSTAGAVIDTLRAFSDPTVIVGATGPKDYYYFVELVNCGKTVEPFAVQIELTLP